MTTPSLAVNPYYFGRAIRDPKDFFGRKQESLDAFEHIAKGECVNVVGERRSGKTSFLFHLCDPTVRQTYLPGEQDCVYIFLDAEIAPQNPEGFFRALFTQIKARVPELQVNPETEPMNEHSVNQALQSLAPKRLVVFIDEFESIAQCEHFSPRFFVFLRGLTTCYPLNFVIATQTRLFDCCPAPIATSPFPNIFRALELGLFTMEEAQEFIVETSQRSGVPIHTIRDEVIAMAGRSPYLLQIACWHYFRAWSEHGDFGCEVRRVVQRSFEDDAEPYFDGIWKRYLTPEERQALQLLFNGHRPSPALARQLEKKGYAVDGKIASEGMAQFVKRQDSVALRSAPVVPGVPAEGVHIDIEAGNTYLNAKLIDPPLPKYQFELLKLLFENRNKVCTPYMIVKAVWSEEYIDEVDDQRIAQLIRRLRQRIEPDGKPWKYILTVRGRGLMLAEGHTVAN